MEQLRLYTFINFYLSPIQQGIQTAHIVHELFNKYSCDIEVPNPFKDKGSWALSGHVLDDWSRNHKTIIVLNAGADPEIEELKNAMIAMDYPWVEFHEDAGLCGARTGIGVVLPESIFNARFEAATETESASYKSRVGEGEASELHWWYEGSAEFNFLKIMKTKRLA